MRSSLDRPREVKIRRGHSKLSVRGTAIRHEVQAANGAAIQNWFVHLILLGYLLLTYPFFLAVKPDATPEEIKAVINDDSGGQIFQQAVSLLC